MTDLYYAYLHRVPDDSGLGWWIPLAAGSVQNRINVLSVYYDKFGLRYSVYAKYTPDGRVHAGDLESIIYGPSDEETARYRKYSLRESITACPARTA